MPHPTSTAKIRLRVERQLGNAQRCLWHAIQEAETWADQSLADDLHQILDELRRIHESLIKN